MPARLMIQQDSHTFLASFSYQPVIDQHFIMRNSVNTTWTSVKTVSLSRNSSGNAHHGWHVTVSIAEVESTVVSDPNPFNILL